MWPKFLRNYFGLTAQQSRGLFVLVVLCAVLVVFRIVQPYFSTPSTFVLRNLPTVRFDSLAASTIHQNNNSDSGVMQNKVFAFNPNTVSYEQLLQLGLSPSSAKALIGFRIKGFVFRLKTDLQKVYGIRESDYKRLEPYIVLETNQPPVSNASTTLRQKNEMSAKAVYTIEINTADSLTWLQLKGIGPVYTKRILKYRALLGGFAEIEQLKEVYGITDTLFNQIKTSLVVNRTLLQKIQLNSADFKTLNRHPYLSYEITKLLVNTRKKHKLNEGSLKALLADDFLYQRLMPYCSFD